MRKKLHILPEIRTKYKMSELSKYVTQSASISHSLTNTKTTKTVKNIQQESKISAKNIKKETKNAFFAPITEIFP